MSPVPLELRVKEKKPSFYESIGWGGSENGTEHRLFAKDHGD